MPETTASVMTPGEQAIFHELRELQQRVAKLEASSKKSKK